MRIDPARIKDQMAHLKRVLEWRKVSHEFEEAKPFPDDDGNMIQHWGCNKCGLSAKWPVHEPPYGEKYEHCEHQYEHIDHQREQCRFCDDIKYIE
jgi:hypothetical protein